MPRLPSSLDRLLLGREARQRLPLLRTLTAGGVYLVCLLLQAHSVWAGYVPEHEAALVFGFVLLGQIVFYAALRSGLTLRLRDPALTMHQMLFALSALALAYRINPHVRGALLMVVPLVLIFGAFTLTPSRCRALGWSAVGLFGGAMAWGATHEPHRIDLTIEWIHFLFVASVLPTISLLAGQLSQWRGELQAQKRELRVFAREASKVLRSRDLLARWGGEEFLLVMPDTQPSEAQHALARLRARLARPEAWADCPAARATFSAGLAVQGGDQTLEAAVRVADAALYAAKHAGRDRVVAA